MEFKTLLLELPANSSDKQGPVIFLTGPGKWQTKVRGSGQGEYALLGGLPFRCLVVVVPVWEREGWVGGEKLFAADHFLAISVEVFPKNMHKSKKNMKSLT